MGLFDRWRKKKPETAAVGEPVTAPAAPRAARPSGGLPEPEPHVPPQLPPEQIAGIVLDYIRREGVPGLSPEEVELAGPFFVRLFDHYHRQSAGRKAAWCSRKDHRLPEGKPIFVTGSGKLLCERCALEYIIGFASDWTYYLGNIAAGIGAVSLSLQNQGSELQGQIKEMREAARVRRIGAIEDQGELLRIALDGAEDVDTRKAAMAKLADPALRRRVALEADIPVLRMMALDTPLDQETLAGVVQNDKTFAVREAALKRLTDQRVLAQVALCDASRDLRDMAVRRLTDKAILAQITRSDPVEYVRQSAAKRLEELGGAS